MRTKLTKIKLFKENSITKLEKTINSWLEKNKYIEIVQILQSETVMKNSPDAQHCNSSSTITICYKELEEQPLATKVESADFSKEKLDDLVKVKT